MSTGTADRTSHRAFVTVTTGVFAASVTAAVAWTASMAAMGGMPMPGGWTMSMAWMRMPDQSWAGAALSFLGMWIVMTVAMMQPSLVPMLRRYRDGVAAADRARLGRLTSAAAAGYFAVWIALGVVVFPAGAALSAVEMQHPAVARMVPAAVGLVVLAAGALQLTTWKRRRLACCRGATGAAGPGAAGAWRHGLRLGLDCTSCCAGFTAILLAAGVMDLRVMAAVTAAITLERIAPGGERIARALGALGVVAGLVLVGASLAR